MWRASRGARRPLFSFSECGSLAPGLLAVREGISPGWGDDYDPQREGQYLDITTVPAGRYRLVHRANPYRRLREATLANNTASLLIELTQAARPVRPAARARRGVVPRHRRLRQSRAGAPAPLSASATASTTRSCCSSVMCANIGSVTVRAA